jgi:fibronectin-binding autotransporter adhesin
MKRSLSRPRRVSYARPSRPARRPRPLGVSLARFTSVAALCGALLAGAGKAATYFWDADGSSTGNSLLGAGLGGSGTWDTSTPNWWNGATADLAWPNLVSPGDTAIFGGSAGTVTLGSALNANGLTFAVSDYTLTGAGANNLTLTGATPTITVLNTGDQATINTNISLAANATFGGAGNLKLGGVISGLGFSITKTGTGAVTLSGANDFTGGLTLNAGTVVATNAAAMGTGALTLKGGVLQLAGDAGTPFGNSTVVQGNTQITTDTITATTGVTHTLGTLSIGAQTLAINGGSHVTTGTQGLTFGDVTVTGNAVFSVYKPTTASGTATTLLTLGALDNGGNTPTFNGTGDVAQTGVWSGAGGVLLNGAGTLTLNQANSFTGPLTIQNGTVVATGNAQDAGALALGAGTGASAISLINGTLRLAYAPGTNVDFTRGGTTGNMTVNGSSTLIAGAASPGAGNTYTLGALSIGNSRLTISGGPNVNGGTAGVVFGAVTVTGPSVFTVNNPALGGTTLLSLGAVTNGANSVTFTGNGNVIQTGIWGTAATAGVVYAGSGSLLLNQSNAFPALTMAGGTVIADSNAAALGGGTLTLTAGNLRLTGAPNTPIGFGRNTTINGAVTITGDVNATVDPLDPNAGIANTYTLGTLSIGAQQLTLARTANVTSGTSGVVFGATTLTASGTTLDIGAGSNLTLGAIGGSFNVIKNGAGTLTLVGPTSTRAASTSFLNAGTIVQTGAGGIGTVAALLNLAGGTLDLASDTSTLAYPTTVRGNVTILSDATAGGAGAGVVHTLGTLTSLGANTITVGKGANVTSGTAELKFGVATTNAATTFSVGAGAKLTLNSTLANGGFTTTFGGAGDATVTGIISGGGGLISNLGGTLTLTAANTFTGNATINSGTVVLGNVASLGPVATTTLTMNGGTLNLAAVGSTMLGLSGSASSNIISGGAATLTVNPVANSTSVFAGTIGGGSGTLNVTVGGTNNGGGALTLGGNNTYAGTTLLTSGRLNLNASGSAGNSAIGTGLLSITSGIIDNTSGADVTLATNNTVTIGGNFSFGGTGNLNLGTGPATNGGNPRVITLLGTSGKTLTFGTLADSAPAVNTFNTFPGSNSKVAMGVLNLGPTAGGTTGINGNSEIAITGGINPTLLSSAFFYTNSGTLTLSGASTYTGLTTINAGRIILDASTIPASLVSGNALTLGGGAFVFKGDGNATGQTLGTVTVSAGASSLQVVGGAAVTGSTLTLGALTTTANNGLLNINLSGNLPAVTTSTGNSANDNLFSARGAVTVTTGGTTEFATRNASNQLVQYTGQTDFVPTGSVATTNYKLSGDGQVTAVGGESMNSLRLTTAGAPASLDLNGKPLTLTSGGLLFVGADNYEIKDVATGGSLKSNTATNSDLIVQNFGTGALTISARIAPGAGTSVVTVGGTGVTIFSGDNTYTGATLVGGGATLSIGANNALGAAASAGGLTLNNATLQATGTFGLNNGANGTNDRPIVLGAGGGTFDVTGSNQLTVSGVIAFSASSTLSGNLTKTNTGTLILAGINTYAGGFTNIQEGRLVLGTKSAALVGALPAATVVSFGTAGGKTGVLQLGDSTGGTNGTGNPVSQTVAGLVTLNGSAGNAIVGGNGANSTLTYTGTPGVPTTFDGTIGGSGTNQNNLALTVTAGALTLTGTNTYLGNTTVSGAAAVLNINSASAIGAGTLNLTNATAVIDNSSAAAITLSTNNNVATTTGFIFAGTKNLSFGAGNLSTTLASTPISVYGGSTLGFGGSLVNNVAAGVALTLTVNGPGGTLSLGGFNMQNVSGAAAITDVITGSGNVKITGPITPGAFFTNNALSYTGTGVLTLSGANTYTGLTTMNNAGGKLMFGPGASLNGGVGPLTLTAGTIDLNGQNIGLGTFTPTAGLVTNSGAAATLTATALVGTTGTVNFSGNLSLDLANSLTSGATMTGSFTNTGTIKLTAPLGGGAVAISGNILSTGDIFLVGNTGTTSVVTLSGALINPVGSINSSGTGTSANVISGTIGSNVTAINQTGTAPLTISGALYLNPAGTTVTQSGTGTLLLGTAAISGTGNLTVINSSSATSLVTLSAVSAFTGNLLLQANGSSTATISASGAINSSGTITNSGSGSGTVTIGGIIGASVTSVTQDSATSPLVLGGANAFAGGLFIKSGTVSGSVANSFGANTNPITLGNTAPNSNANVSLIGTAAVTFAQPILVPGTNAGTASISSAAAAAVFSGPVTLASHDLALGAGAGALTLSGGLTGAGNVTIVPTAAGVISLTTNPINMVGTITNAGTGAVASTTVISGGVGPNVTAITENSAFSALTISSGQLTVNPNGTTLTNNNPSGAAVFTVSGGINGVGALTLNNNSAVANGITISTTAITMAGPITVSGTGTGGTTISSIIGADVTSVMHSAANAQLTLSGANAFTGGLNVKSGTVLGQTSVNAFGANTNVITLGDSVANANPVTLKGNGLTYAQPIVLASGTTGAITLSNLSTTASTFSGGITGANNLVFNSPGGAFPLTISGGALSINGSITNTGTGTGATTISSVIGSGVTSIVQNSTTSGLVLQGNNLAFGTSPGFGTISINAGTLTANTSLNALGVAPITLGSTTVTTNPATLALGLAGTYTNPITVASGSSGTLTLQGTTVDGVIVGGLITLANNLTLGIPASSWSITKGITGTGNVTVTGGATKTLTISTTELNFTGNLTNQNSGAAVTTVSAPVKITGNIINNSTSTGAFTVSGILAGSVGAVTQNSATSPMVLSGANTAFTGNITIVNGRLSGGTVNSALGTGGTIFLGTVDTLATGATLSVANSNLNFSNPIVITGNGNGGVLTITQGTTALPGTFSGPITTNSSFTVASGDSLTTGSIVLTGGISMAAGATAANLTLNNKGTTSTITISGQPVNNAGSITAQGVSSGAITISADIGNKVTDITQNLTNAAAVMTLSGANIAYTGATTVNGGTLNISGGANAPLATTGISVASNASLSLINSASYALNLNSLSLGVGAAGGTTTLGLDVSSPTVYDRLSTTAAATTANTVRINLNAPASAFVANNTFTFLSAASGLDGAAYQFTGLTGGFNYSTTVNPTTVALNVGAANTTASTVYWKGGFDNKWNSYDAAAGSNFTSDQAGTMRTAALPGTGTTVVFSADTPTGATLTSTLETSFAINDLVIRNNGPVTTLNIQPGAVATNSLTLAPSSPAVGLTVETLAPANINVSVPIVLGSSQTWRIADSGTKLTASGVISGNAPVLNLAGPGSYILSNAANTFTGDVVLADTSTLTVAALGNLGVAGLIPTANTPKTVTLLNGATFKETAALNPTNNTLGTQSFFFMFGQDSSSANTLDMAPAAAVLTLDDPGQFTLRGTLNLANVGTLLLSNQDYSLATAVFGNRTLTTGVYPGSAINLSGSTTLSLRINANVLGGANAKASIALNSGTTLDLRYDTSTVIGNNVSVFSGGSIVVGRNVAGTTGVTHTMGALTIGDVTLDLKPGAIVAANTPYGLAFAATTLTGSPFFNIAANGTAPGTLSLGSVNDGGVARTLTYSPNGILRFGGTATSFVAANVVQIPYSAVVLGATDALGTGAQIVLGDISGSASATLRVDTNGVVTSNPILVQAGSSGVSTIEGAEAGVASFVGTVTLNKDVTLSAGPGSVTTFTKSIDDGASSFAITKTGPGTIILLGNQAHDGGTTVTGGLLALGGTGYTNVTLNGGSLQLLGGGSVASAINVGTAGGGYVHGANSPDLSAPGMLAWNNASTFTVDTNGFSPVYASAFGSSTGNFVKTGAGTLTLKGGVTGNTFGTLTAAAGTTVLDFSTATSPIAGSATGLVLRGGTLTLNGIAGTNTQAFASTTLVEGGSTINTNNTGTINLALGSIVRDATNRGTVNFVVPASGSFTTTSSNTNGILGGWATVNGSRWATVNAGAIEAYLGDTVNLPDSGSVAGTNYVVNTAPNLTAAGFANALRFETTGLAVNLGANNLTVGAILSPVASASFTGTGVLSPGAGNELLVYVGGSASNTLTISSVLGGGSLTKTGPGRLVVDTSTSTLSGGPITVNQGIMEMDNTARYGAATGLILNGGQMTWSANQTMGLPVTLGLAGGTIAQTGAGNTIFGTAANLGFLGSGSRTLTFVNGGDRLYTFLPNILDNGGATSVTLNGTSDTAMAGLSGVNAYSGATTINRGVLRVTGASGISPYSNVVLNGGTNRALIEGTTVSNRFTNPLGVAPGQVQWLGNGGFSYNSGTAGSIYTVNLGGAGAPVQWAAGSFVPNGFALQFSHEAANNQTSNGTVDFQNPIDLNGGARNVDVADGIVAVDAKLSGGIFSSTATGTLNKTGSGTLVLGGTNSGTNLNVLVNSGTLAFAGASSVPATAGAFITINAGGSVALTGSTDPFTALAGKIAPSSTGAILLDTSSSAALDMSPYSGLFLGAQNATFGQPVVFTGVLTPNGDTFRVGNGRTISGSNGASLTGGTQVNLAPNAWRDILILGGRNQLADGAAPRSLNVGSGVTYITSYNTYSGGTNIGQFNGQAGSAVVALGNGAALGAGPITFTPATISAGGSAVLGAMNGDRTLNNNVTVAQAGNWVASADTASDAVANSASIRYMGTTTLAGAVTIIARPTNNPVFMGDIVASGPVGISGNVSFLTQGAGAVAKSYAQPTNVGTNAVLVIDSNASLGSSTDALSFGSTGTSGLQGLKIQPGTPLVTLTGRDVLINANYNWTIDTPGGPIAGVTSELSIPGVISGGGTGVTQKIGLGTLRLSGANTVINTPGNGLQIYGGSVLIDGTNSPNARYTDSITTQLTLGTSTVGSTTNVGAGGTFAIQAGGNTITQTFTNLNTVSKENGISLSAGDGGQANLIFNGFSLSRGLPGFPVIGGTLAITTATSGTGSTSITMTGTVTNGAATPNQIWLDETGVAFAAINGTDWAARNGNNQIVPLGSAGAGSYTANTATALSGNADMTAATPLTTLAANTSVTSLRFNAAAAETINLNGSTLTTGGILVGTGAGSANQVIQGAGKLQGPAGRDLVVFQANTAGALTISAAIGNNGAATSLTKGGAGTLVLTGNNTFTGQIFFDKGTISVDSVGTAAAPNPLGQAASASTNMLFNGGSLRFTGLSGTTDRGATFNAFSQLEVTNPAGNLTMTGTMIGVSGLPGYLQKVGPGTLTLGSNTAGDNVNLSVLVTDGTLNLNKASTAAIHAVSGGNNAALIVGPNASAVVTGTGGDQIYNGSSIVLNGSGATAGKLDLFGHSETIDSLAGSGTVTNTASNATAITLTFGDNAIVGSQASNSAYTLNAANAGVASTGLNSFSGKLTDDGVHVLALTKAGPGTQILSGTGHTYSGDTSVSSGTLLLRATNVLPSGAGKGNVNLAGSSVIFGVRVPGTLDMGGFDQAINGLSSTSGGIVTNTPASSVTSNQTNTLTVGNNNASSSFDGVFQDGYIIHPGTTPVGYYGFLALTKTGAGSLTLRGASTNSGLVTVNQGDLQLNNTTGNALSTNVAVNGGTLRLLAGNQLLDSKVVTVSSGAFDLNGQSETVGLSLTGGTLSDSNGAGVLRSNAAFDLQSGTVSAVLGGTSGLNKTGPGMVVLSKANTYAGATSISAGTVVLVGAGAVNSSSGIALSGAGKLYADGATAVSVPVTVGTGATLGGSGTVTGLVTVNGGALEAGHSAPGTLTLGNVTFSSTGSINLANIGAGSGASLVQINGTLIANGGAGSVTLNATNSGVLNNGTYKLVGYSAPIGGAGDAAFVVGDLGQSGRQLGTLDFGVSNAGYISVTLNGDSPVWTGFDTAAAYSANGGYNTNTPGTVSSAWVHQTLNAWTTTNWVLQTAGTPTGYSNNDSVLFNDSVLTAGRTTAAVPGAILNTSTRTVAVNSTNGLAVGQIITGPGIANGTTISAVDNANNQITLSANPTAGDGTTARTLNVVTGTISGSTTVDISSGNITPSSVTFDNSAANYTLTGSNGITGNTSLVKSGTGTVTIGNANSFTGGVSINGGVIRLNHTGALGTANSLTFGATAAAGTMLQLNGFDTTVTALDSASAAVAVENGASGNAVLTVNRVFGTSVFAGSLRNGGSGTLGLAKTGGGTLRLTGDNSYSGATTISGSGGVLQIGDGGTTGSLSGATAVTIGSEASLVFNRSDASTFNGSTTGAGSLVKLGAGTLTLTGSNAPGSTTIAGGTIQIGNGGTSGSLAGAIVNNGAIAYNRTDASVLSGNISGTGSVSVLNGTLVLAGANSYLGTTTIGSGTTLQIGNGGPSGSLGSGAVVNNGTLAFKLSAPLVVPNAITSGALQQLGTSTVILTAANTYDGGTTIAAGATLQVGDGTTGSIAGVDSSLIGDVIANGSISFNRAGNHTWNNQITGTGNVTIAGGTWQFTKANDGFTGSATINAGATLELGNGGTVGSLGALSFIDNGTLSYNKTTPAVLSNISGTGGVSIATTVNVTMAGTNTYSGPTVLGFTGSGTVLKPAATNSFSPNSTIIVGNNNAFTSTIDLNGTDQTIGGLTVSTNTAAVNTITIAAGRTLTINGPVTIGSDVAAGMQTTKATFTGGGNLVVNGNLFQVGGVTTNTAGVPSDAATADLTGLAQFTANLGASGILRVGDNNGLSSGFAPSGGLSTLLLAPVSTINAGRVSIGGGTSQNTLQTLTLGTTSTTINADIVYFGSDEAATSGRGQGVMNFAPGTTGTLSIHAFDGVGRADVALVDTVTFTGGSINGTMDLTGHTSTLFLNQFNVGVRRYGSPQTGGTVTSPAIGIFAMDQGTLDATGMIIGLKTSFAGGTNVGTAPIIGTVTLGSATGNYTAIIGTGGINMASNTTGLGSAVATLNLLAGGTVTVNADIVKVPEVGTSPAASTATVTLNGATLDMTGHDLGKGNTATTTRIDTLNFQSGTLKNVHEINGGSGLNKTGAGVLALGGTNTYTGTTNVAGGTLRAAAANAFSLSSGVTLANTAGALLDLNGFNQTIPSLSGGGTTGGNVSLGSATLTIDETVASVFEGSISGAGGVTKAGPATLTLMGSSSYTGPTTVTGGTLEVSGNLTATSDINVNSGAFSLAASNVINNAANVNLAGGTFKTGGFSEGDLSTAGLGTLSVSATSVIDFGVSGTSQLLFAGLGSHTPGTSLSITNWSTPSDPNNPGNDHLLFAGDENARFAFDNAFAVNDISFNGNSGFATVQLDAGHFEVIPEPSSLLLTTVAFGLLGLRRRRRSKVH